MQNKITVVAMQLAIRHSDDVNIPVRYRTKSAPKEKARSKASEAIEVRFSDKVQSWVDLINSMLGLLDPDQAWRFITTSPMIALGCKDLVECDDFLDFNHYMVRRRDNDLCDDNELGQLALLLTELQATIERRICLSTPT